MCKLLPSCPLIAGNNRREERVETGKYYAKTGTQNAKAQRRELGLSWRREKRLQCKNITEMGPGEKRAYYTIIKG